MSSCPKCEKCGSEYTYQDQAIYVCPECAFEWPVVAEVNEAHVNVIKDANGNILNDGDMVTVIKDLKVKGSSSVIKLGTKVRILRLVEGDHNIDCRVEGIGQMGLKSEFVKKII